MLLEPWTGSKRLLTVMNYLPFLEIFTLDGGEAVCLIFARWKKLFEQNSD